jgi:hypothetical protein
MKLTIQAHASSLVRDRGSVRRKRRRRRLLVHVLADRQGIPNSPREENKAAFRDIVRRGSPPGLPAFDGELAMGWCQLTPRQVAVAESRLAAQEGG